MTSTSVFIPSDSNDSLSIRLGWAADGKIALYQLPTMDSDTLEAWYAAVYEDLMAWPDDRPYRVLHDLSRNEHANLTPRLRAYAMKLLYARPVLKGRAALLFHRSPVVQIAVQVVRSFAHLQSRSGIVTELFIDRQKAMDWLLAGLEADQR